MMDSARRLLNARCEVLRGTPASSLASEELSELMHALQRMEEGTWGQCEKCGRAIGHNRLQALPETRWCLNCATR